MTKILLLEDHEDTRSWLHSLIVKVWQSPVVIEAATVATALRALETQTFEFALLDINLPDGSGIDIAKRITDMKTNTYIVMATIYDDDEHLFDALASGAQGYLLKEQSEDELIKKLLAMLAGEPPLSPAIALKMIHHFQQNQLPSHDLTPREVDVLTLVAKGLSRKQIAELLELRIHTVSGYIKTVYSKLNINSKSEAALEAARIGLINVNT